MFFKRQTRKIAMATAVLFLMNSAVDSPVYAQAISGDAGVIQLQGVPQKFSPEYLLSLSRQLPTELGHLGSGYLPIDETLVTENRDAPFIIHIQDAHANVEAQERIYGILNWIESLHEEYQIQTPLVVAVEGAVKQIHPEYLELFPQFPAANEAFVENLKDKGELNGVELYAWEKYKQYKNGEHSAFRNVLVHGVENAESYRENLRFYRALIQKKEDIEQLLKPLKGELGVAQSLLLNTELRDFIKDSERPEVLSNLLLKHTAELLNINLEDALEQIRFPNVSRIVYLKKIESLLDKELARMEWQDFQKYLSLETISAADVNLLAETIEGKQQSSVSIRKVLERVYEAAGTAELPFDEYPYMTQWLAFQILSQELDSAGFAQELKHLQNMILAKLAQTDKEKEFIAFYNRFQLFEKMLYGKLTREEFDVVAQDPQAMSPVMMLEKIESLTGSQSEESQFKKAALKNQKTLMKAYRVAWKFYEGARLRDQSLLDNALAVYEKKKNQLLIEDEQNATGVLVVVSGGFHSEGLETSMREENIPHIVITPRISKVTKDGLYEKVIKREHADLSDYFTASVLSKQEALFLRGLVETAAPKLTEIYGIDSEKIPNWVDQVIKRHPVLQRRLDSIVLSGAEKPFARVTLKGQAEQGVADVADQAVSEIFLTSEGVVYDQLSSFTPSSADVEAVRLQATPSGYLRIEPEVKDNPSIIPASGIVGAAGSSVSQKALISQVRGFAASGFFSGPAGATRLPQRILPQRRSTTAVPTARSEQRSVSEAIETGIIQIDDSPELDQSVINRIVTANDVVYIKADAHQEISFAEYKERIRAYVSKLGEALKEVRTQEYYVNEKRAQSGEAPLPPVHKVFVFKTWTDAGSTDRFYDDLKYARQPTAEEGGNDYNFDVVFQADFSFTAKEGSLVEPQIVFGLRNYDEAAYKTVDENASIAVLKQREAERKERTLARLRKDYAEQQEAGTLFFTDVRNAEKAKDDLILYLSAKLAHFNDLALISNYYGADLSAVAYGAGLDKRIRTPFTNPSLGFGGRLSRLLEWISEAEVERLLPSLEARTNFFPGSVRGQEREDKIEHIQNMISMSIKQLRDMAEKPEVNLTIFDILANLPQELHYLFLLQTIIATNKQNIKDFTSAVVDYAESHRSVRKVAVLGAAYREGDPNVTKSPIKSLISDLVKSEKADIVEFYVADPVARAELVAWLESKKTDPQELKEDTLGNLINQRRIRFIGLDEDDEPLSIIEAVRQSDIAVIATDSNPELKKLQSPEYFDQFVSVLGDKPLFDGVNFTGLRADGTEILPISRLRSAGINYYSVGRPGLGIFEQGKSLLDSSVIGRALNKEDPRSELDAIAEYQSRILTLETDDARRKLLAEMFAEQTEKNSNAYATQLFAKNIAVIGGGYVGLTTGANLADLGNDVTVVDIPQKQAAMDALNGPDTVLPIHEPGLKELVERGKENGKLRFQASVEDREAAVRRSQIIYLAVGTPQQDSGAQDPVFILDATSQIAEIIKDQQRTDPDNAYKTIVIKSTVTPQVFQDIVDLLKNEYDLTVGEDYGLVSNPEFLREGQAIKDITVDLDRTVLGFYSEMTAGQRARVEKDILEAWYPLMLRTPHTVLLTDTATSTMVKYAANAYLAVSISMANVFADSAVRSQATFQAMAAFLRRDPRVGKDAFLACGPGYGGSCFPKDVRALNYLSSERIWRGDNLGGSLEMIVFADQMNQFFKVLPYRRSIRLLSKGQKLSDAAALQNKRIAILGMAFKGDTDDMREAQSAHLLSEYLDVEAAGLQINIDDQIHRVDDAPPFETNVERFKAELYKHFKNDNAFLKKYRSFKDDLTLDDEAAVALFNSIRSNAQFRRVFIESLKGLPAVSAERAAEPFLNKSISTAELSDEDAAFYWRAFTDMIRKRRIPDEALKSFYFNYFFLGDLERSGGLNFVNGVGEALAANKGPVDLVIIMTPWNEYRSLPDALRQFGDSRPIIQDERGLLTEGQVADLSARGYYVSQPGREDVLPAPDAVPVDTERNEMREASFALQQSIEGFRGAELQTSEFHQLFNSLIIGPLQGVRTPEELIQLFPELASRHAVRENIAAGFLATDFFKDVMILAAVRYVQVAMSDTSAASDEALVAVEAVREALGPFNWLLDRSDIAIRVISELKPNFNYTELFRLAAVLAAANPNSDFAFLVESATQNDTRNLAAFLADKMIELKLPADRLLSQFKFMAVSDDHRSFKRAVIQIYSEDPKRVSATLGQSLEFLERLGYVPNMSRLHQDLELQVAIAITAALLRQLDDPLQVLSVQGIGQQFGLDIDLLVQRIGQAIQVLNHLATQA